MEDVSNDEEMGVAIDETADDDADNDADEAVPDVWGIPPAWANVCFTHLERTQPLAEERSG
jgi:hypothetical protein